MQFNPSIIQELHSYQQYKNTQLNQIYHPQAYNLRSKQPQSKKLLQAEPQSSYNNKQLQDIYYKQYLLAMHAKEYISLKQKKASQLKNHNIFEKSKRVEASLSKWNEKVEKKRVESVNKVDIMLQTQALNISNKKLMKSQSSSKHTKYAQNQQEQIKLTNQQKQIVQPEVRSGLKKYEPINYRKLKHKTINLLKSQFIQYEDMLEQPASLQIQDLAPNIKISVKNQRINQARYMKYYIQQTKLKQFISKELSFKKMQKQHLSQIKDHIKLVQQTIQEKHNIHMENRSRKKLSLPIIRTSLLKTKLQEVEDLKANRPKHKIRIGDKVGVGVAAKKTARNRQKSMFQLLKEESSLYD